MKTLYLILLALALSAPWVGSAQTKKSLRLTIGSMQDEQIPGLPDDHRFEGDYKKVTNLFLWKENKTLRFEPAHEGTATLTIHDAKGTKLFEYLITVQKSDLNKVAREIRALLSDVEGIDIKIINNRVVVDGQILLPRDMNRIYSVVSQYGDQASSIVTLSPMAQKKIANLIERDINNPEIHVRAVNDKFILEGVAANDAEKQRAEIIAKTYVPDIIVEAAEASGLIKKRKVDAVINLITLKPPTEPEPGKIIQLVIHFVEMQKDYERGFRFQWTPDVSDQTSIEMSQDSRSPGGILTSLTATISNLLPKLNWAKEHGHARVLQSTSLIVEDGQMGVLQSTTRLPYQTMTGAGVPVTNFEEAGLVSEITPKIVSSKSDSINLNIKFTVKALLGMTDKGPILSNKTINTRVVVRSAYSAAIGGLVSNDSGKNYNKLPKNTSKNPLFSLYASKDFRRNQSQFVVFITPIIKTSASEGTDKIKEKFRIQN